MEPVKGKEGIVSKVSDNLYYNHCTGRYFKPVPEIQKAPKKRIRKIKGVEK